ncbi:MAG: hypothetical protein KGJ13_13285 [Patescibacteria group bacterium]|nr:hypothetical protein [Patescibacteria group bacterium]
MPGFRTNWNSLFGGESQEDLGMRGPFGSPTGKLRFRNPMSNIPVLNKPVSNLPVTTNTSVQTAALPDPNSGPYTGGSLKI